MSTPVRQEATTVTRPRDKMTRVRIIEAASKVAATEGLDALGMRDLAKRLGVATMVLYRHVGSRDELVDQVVAEMLEDYFTEHVPVRAENWQQTLRERARALLELLCSNRAVLEAVQRAPRLGTRSAVDSECVLGALVDAGFDVQQVVATHAAILSLALGFAGTRTGRAAAREATGRTLAEERAQILGRMADLGAQRYPALTVCAPLILEQFSDEVFDRTLDLLIAGLEASLPQREIATSSGPTTIPV